MEREKELPTKSLVLRKNPGERFSVLLRPFRRGDEEGILRCIREEYGGTYFRRGFYDPDYYGRMTELGAVTFLVAETEPDGIIGILILKGPAPEETLCEMAALVLQKKYRGCGMAAPFLEYGKEILLSRPYSAALCLPVMFHDMTQRLLSRLGFVAAGLSLNVFDMETVTHSYDNGRNRKHSQGIQIMAHGKRDAGALYLPRRHREFGRRIYDRLGVSYRMEEEGAPPARIPSDIRCANDDRQHSAQICIQEIGGDLESCIREIHRAYPLRGKQTANVYLNCNLPQAVWAYETLTRMGYFFTGLKPLCSKREYLVMHHRGETEIFWVDYAASREFSEILDYVRKAGREEGHP